MGLCPLLYEKFVIIHLRKWKIGKVAKGTSCTSFEKVHTHTRPVGRVILSPIAVYGSKRRPPLAAGEFKIHFPPRIHANSHRTIRTYKRDTPITKKPFKSHRKVHLFKAVK